CVGARFEDSPQPTCTIAMAQCFQGVCDRGRMMTEIVDHLHPSGLPAEFLPPGDPGKSPKRVVDFCLRHIVKPRRHRRHCSVVHIKFAYEGNLERLISKLEFGTCSRGSDITDALRA